MTLLKPKFSGHQTFVFRFGWLEKGFKYVASGKSFSDENAIVDLGVGKNMVESINYWCEMSGVTENGKISEFANKLLDENSGWDPYLEDNASLWLLHWKLCSNQAFFTAGTALFSRLHKPEFSKREVAEAANGVIRQHELKLPSETMLLRDVDCYIRAYAGLRRFEKKKSGEESFGCPLQELSLIQPMNDGEMFRFNIGPKITLPSEVIGFAIWDYLNRSSKRDSARIQEVLYHEYSPGQIFMLDENSLLEAIDALKKMQKWGKYFNFHESGGVALIYCNLNNGYDLLNAYYRGVSHQ